MKLLGLEYIGYVPSGVALVLYGNGYKTVTIDALHPYMFTNKTDDTSDRALDYYQSLDSDLFIKIITSEDNDPDNNEDDTESNESEMNTSG